MSTLTELLNDLQITYPEYGFVSTAPAERWEDGMIVGNGSQGALCFSRPHSEEIILSHERLFLPIYPIHEYVQLGSHLDEFRDLIFENKGEEAMRRTIALIREKPYLQRDFTDPFIGACALMLNMDHGSCETYARSVDFETGHATTAWKDDKGLFHRRTFASRARQLIAVEITSPTQTPFSLSCELSRIERDLDHDLYDKTVADTERTANPDFLSFRVKLNQLADDQHLMGYCVGVRVVPTGGKAAVNGNRLTVENAESLLLIIDVQPEFAGTPLSPEDLRTKLVEVPADYDTLLSEHAAIHSELFNRVSLNLCDKSEEQMPTEDLHAGSKVGNTTAALVQKTFDAGRYGIIACTGALPPALQGIWTGTWKPNWSGDFTLNGNVQSAIAAALPGNHTECMRVTLDYLSELLDDFKTNARGLFGFRGIYVPWRSSTHGQVHCCGTGDPEKTDGSNAFPGMYWFGGTAWWAWFYYDYWLYTGDETFFEKQLKPFMLESADFYEDYLSVEKDGKLVAIPSYSPENKPSNGHCLQPNATMTIAAVKQLLRTLGKIADRLGVDDARQKKWADILAKLPDYQVDPSGALAEWTWPGILNNDVHRHASHLYPVYDGVDPEVAASPALQEACRVAIEKRLEYRRPKNGAEMSFGLTQLGMSATHLQDKALAWECLEWMVNSYWSPAMVSQHNPGTIFNLDISGGLPAIILNMLVQSREPATPGGPWQIIPLPCLPDAWPDGSVSGVRCRGGFEVSLSWESGKVKDLDVTSLRGEEYETVSV